MAIKFLSGVNIDSNTLFVDDANNRVGIGTNSPSRQLELVGADAYIQLTRSSTSTQATLGFNTGATNDWLIRTGDGSTSNLQFYSYGTSSYVMTIARSSGNVGIGTTSPANTLQIGSVGATGYSGNRLAVGDGTNVVALHPGAVSYLTANGDIVVGAGGNTTNQVYVKSGGNVGIGTTSPNQKLHVVGNTTITGVTYTDIVQTYSGASIDFRHQDASVVMRVDTANARVGIGTTSPSYKLDVSGDIRSTTIDLGTQGVNVSSYGFLSQTLSGQMTFLGHNVRASSTVNNTALVVNGGWISSLIKQYYNEGITFHTSTTEYAAGATYPLADTERMRITSAGNVGIGTTSPSYKLQVNGEGNGLYVIGANSAPYTQTIAKFVYGGNNNSINIENQSGKASFQARDNSDAAMSLLLNPVAGSVLIGTGTDAGYKLDVNGTGRFTGSITSNASGVGTLLLGSTSGSSQIAGRITATESPSYSSTGKIGFSVTTWGIGTDYGLTEVMAIDMRGADSKAPTIWMNPFGGNVGIGTTSPSTKLHVFTTSNSDQELLRLTVAPADSSGAKPKAILGFYTPAEANTQDYTSGRITSKFDVAGYANSRVTIESLDSGGNFIETLTAKNGNVGIGTTSPAKILDINIPAASHANYGIRLNSAVGYGGASLYHDYGQGNGATVFKITNDYGDARINLTQDGYDASGSPSSIRFFTAPQGGGDTGLERVRIASTGNVGIGTTSPSTKLDVIGVGAFGTMTSSRGLYSNGLSLQNNTGEATSLFIWQSGVASAHIGSPANSTSLHIVNSYNTGLITDPNSIVLTNTGNVGIGTTAPGAKLEIAQNTDNTDGPTLRIANNANTLSNGQLIGAIDFYNGDDSGTGNAVGAFIRSFTADAVLPVSSQYLSFAAGGTTERMRIASTGATRLNAYGSGSFTGTVAYNLAVDSSGNIIETAGGVVDGSGTANYVSKWSDANTLTDSQLFDNGTNVGIGTTSPATKLDVNGGINIANGNNLTWGGDYAAGIPTIAGYNAGAGGALYFYPNGSTSGTKMFIASDGNVGIGTTAPGYKLDVSGTAYISDDLLVGATNATSWHRISVATGGFIAQDGGRGIGAYVDSTAAEFFAYNYSVGSYIPLTIRTSTLNIANNGGSSIIYHDGTNVGIGTTSPSDKLTVAVGNVEGIRVQSSNSGFVEVGKTGGARWRWANDYNSSNLFELLVNDLAGGAPGAHVITVNGSNGAVGIGTTAPTNKLTVYQGGGVRVTGITSGDWIEMSGDLPGYSANQYPVIKSNGTIHFANNNKYSAYLEGANTYFGILDNTTTTRVFLATSGNTYFTGGNVGIGTTSPAANAKLTIDGSADANTSQIDMVGYNSTAKGHLGQFSNNIYLSTNYYYSGGQYNDTAALGQAAIVLSAGATTTSFIDFNLSDAGANNPSSKVRILSSGNVGIGTTAPQAKLDISGGYIRLQEMSNNANGWSVHNNSGYLSSRITTSGHSRGWGWEFTDNYPDSATPGVYFRVGYDGTVSYLTSGNFGIGTNNPTVHSGGNALVVAGKSGVGSGRAIMELVETGGGRAVFQQVGSTTYIGNLAGAGSLILLSNGQGSSASEAVRVTPNSNVLIGTSSDSGSKLRVVGGSTNLALGANGTVLDMSGAAGQSCYMGFDGGGMYQEIIGPSSATRILRLQVFNGTSSYAQFFIDGANNYIYTSANTNFGVGTGSPAYKLDVSGSARVNSTSNLAMFVKTNSAFGAAISYEDSTTGGNDVVSAGAIGGAFYIGTNFSEQMRVSSAGNVIIGSTTDAGYKLDVHGEILGRDDIRILNTYALILNGTDANWRIGRNTITDTGWLTGNTMQMVVFGGQTGQGFQVVNTNGTALFEIDGVAGASRFTNALGVGVNPSGTAGRIDASNDIVAYSTSDHRLKENITPIANALDKVKALTGVEFDWKEETKDVHGYEGHDVGVIAQEVQAVLPEAVRTNDSGYLSVRYEKMIALLVEANKELASRIEELEKKLK